MNSETSNNNTVRNKRTKREPLSYDTEHIYSYRQVPISKAIIDRMIQELPDWPLKNPNAKTLSEFYLSYHISRPSYHRLLNKYPELKDAHEVAMQRIGERLWSKCVDKVYDWSAVRHRLWNYGKEYEDDYRFHADLVAQAKVRAEAELQSKGEQKTQFVVIRDVEYREVITNEEQSGLGDK